VYGIGENGMSNYGKTWARRLAINTMAAAALFAALLPTNKAPAQIAAQEITAMALSLPMYVNPGTSFTDFGNGPLDLLVAQGNARFSTSSGSGLGATVTPLTAAVTPGAGLLSSTTTVGLQVGVASAVLNTGGTGWTDSGSGTATWIGGGCPINPVLNIVTSASGTISVSSVQTPGSCLTLPWNVTASWSISGVTGGTAATFTLTGASPTNPPCVGCLISQSALWQVSQITLPQYAFVSVFTAPTSITMSTAITVPGGTPLSWGSACPTTPGAVLPLQASVGGSTPFFTTARICGYANGAPGASVMAFPIGGH
jgi:hypothetical protein